MDYIQKTLQSIPIHCNAIQNVIRNIVNVRLEDKIDSLIREENVNTIGRYFGN